MKLSIITIAYNAEATIADAVRSVTEQVPMGFELEYIIVDGASTDGTLERLAPFRDRISRIISEPDSGLYDAMNKGVRAATGDWVGILNADDAYAHPQVLANVVSALRSAEASADPSAEPVDKPVEALYGDLDYVDGAETGRVVRRWRSGAYRRLSFLHGWMPPHPAFFLKRTVYEQHGLFSLDLRSAADYELMLRMLYKHRIAAIHVPEVLVHMRTGGVSNASWKNRLRANREDRRAWRMNGLTPMPWTLLLKPLRKIIQWF